MDLAAEHRGREARGVGIDSGDDRVRRLRRHAVIGDDAETRAERGIDIAFPTQLNLRPAEVYSGPSSPLNWPVPDNIADNSADKGIDKGPDPRIDKGARA